MGLWFDSGRRKPKQSSGSDSGRIEPERSYVRAVSRRALPLAKDIQSASILGPANQIFGAGTELTNIYVCFSSGVLSPDTPPRRLHLHLICLHPTSRNLTIPKSDAAENVSISLRNTIPQQNYSHNRTQRRAGVVPQVISRAPG